MDTKKINKYANYRYEIVTPEELREAKWLIEIGTFKDMDDYINRFTRAEIRRMRREETEKKNRVIARRKKLLSIKRDKAA